MTNSPSTTPLSGEAAPMTEQRRHDIIGMLTIISPTPWTWDGEDSGDGAHFVHSADGDPICQVFGNGWDTKRDQEYGEFDHTFIKNAPEYVGELLAEVRRLSTENEHLRLRLEAADRTLGEGVAHSKDVNGFQPAYSRLQKAVNEARKFLTL